MSNINQIILYEMQPLINMLDSFQQALIDPNDPMQQPPQNMQQQPPQDMQPPQDQQSADQNQMSNNPQSNIPDQSMVNAQLTQ